MVSKVEMALDDIIKSVRAGKTKPVNKPQGKKQQPKKKPQQGRNPQQAKNPQQVKKQGRGGAFAGQGRGGAFAGQGRGGAFAGQGRGGAFAGQGRGGGFAGRGRGGSIVGRGGVSKRGQRGGQTQRNPTFTQKFAAPPLRNVPQPIKTGPTKMEIRNLDFGVTDKDIMELFAEFGKMKAASVHYDSMGKSLGTAHVIFERGTDAQKAVSQYNGVELDGRPMRISIDGQKTVAKPLIKATSRIGGGRTQFQGTRGGMRGGNRGRGATRGGGNVKRLQGGPKKVVNVAPTKGKKQPAKQQQKKKKPQPKPVTKEQLDKEMDAYLKQATK